MKESVLVEKIRKALKAKGIKTLKIHGTAYHEAGTPDIIGCIPCRLPLRFSVSSGRESPSNGLVLGQFLALEVKVGNNNPTALQLKRLDEWHAAGAVTAVVWSVESALAVVEGK